jgi:hypothetical protein
MPPYSFKNTLCIVKYLLVRKPEDFQANVLPFKSPLTPLFKRGALSTQFSEELHLEVQGF